MLRQASRPLAVVLLLFLIAASSAVARAALQAPKATVQEVAERLTCQCGCGLTVANCSNPTCGFSVPLRHQINVMLNEGMTADQIVAFFQHKYGDKILSSPPAKGFNLLAWVMPFVAILAGMGLIAIAMLRWRRAETPLAPTPAPGGGAHVDSSLRSRLESELRRQL